MAHFACLEPFQFSNNRALFSLAEGVLGAPMCVEPKDRRLGQKSEQRLDVGTTVAPEKLNVLAIAKSFYGPLV
jgi:hypothetical protein